MDNHKSVDGEGAEANAQENGADGGIVKRWFMVVNQLLVVKVLAVK
jgi:hypothetical protein